MSNEIQLRELLTQLYETVARPQGWASFLETLRILTDSQGAALILHDFRSIHPASATAGYDARQIEQYELHYARLNPWLPKPGVYSTDPAIISSEVVLSLDKLRRTEFYDGFGRKNGVVFSLALNLHCNERDFLYLCLNRGEAEGPHAIEVQHLFNGLLPHFRRVIEMNRWLPAGSGGLPTTGNEVQRRPMFILSMTGKVLEMSPYAERLVANRDGLELDKTRHLRAVQPEQNKRLEAALAAVAAEQHPQMVMLTRTVPFPENTPARHVFALITRTTDRGWLGLAKEGLVVNILDPWARPENEVRDMVDRMFGFTKAESRLAWSLLETGSLSESVEVSMLNRNTAKTHLNAIFEKTKTHRQAELIHLLGVLSRVIRLED